MHWLKACVVWLALMAVEFVHGVLRIVLLVPVVGDFRALQLSVFTGFLIIDNIVFLLSRWVGVESRASRLAIGGGGCF